LSVPGRKLAAIMFTDLVGYSALSQQNEAAAFQLLEQHRSFVRPLFSKFGGVEIKTMGDAFLVQFSSALEAFNCASEIQHNLHDANLRGSRDQQVVLRIGIHVGDVITDNDDIFGDAVNIASRIEPLATPGGICISQQVFDQVKNKIAFPLVSLGSKRLKNIEDQVDVYEVALPWMGLYIRKDAASNSSNLDKRRIAVLPLSSISLSSEDAYFADGMTEELIAALTSVKGLRVIARTSVMKFKNTSQGIKEIARELNVGTVVEGSIRKAGNQLRISVQLIDALTEEHLHASSYDRELQNIFEVQKEIAQTVAETLKVHFSLKEEQDLETRSTGNLEAYTLCLKGRVRWDSRSEAAVNSAISYFERAISLDPHYALAYSGLADCFIILGFYGFREPSSVFPKANEFALKALELNESLAEAHASLGDLSMHYFHNWQTAERELRKAISLKPSYATAYHWYSEYFASMGRLEEALVENAHALELDPFSLVARNLRGKFLYFAGRYKEAEETYKSTLGIEPNDSLSYKGLAEVHTMTGNFDQALSETKRALELSGGSAFIEDDLGYIYARKGDIQKAREILDQLLLSGSRKYVPPYGIAIIYLALGEKDEALNWLEKAFDQANFVDFLKVDPIFDGIRSHPRFIEIEKKMNLDV
jgi:adenylate cyclase